MKTQFNEQILKALNPCKDGLAFAKSCDFKIDRIWNECQRGDWLIWILSKTKILTKPQSVQIAIACSEHVLGSFECKYPNDNRPRLAIEAAKNWLKNPTDENRIAAAAAAYAAAAAAAYTAAAAAAYTADAAAAAAAYTADAAAAAAAYTAAAAAAAYAYAAAADAPERKWQADKIRELIQNPFEKQ